MLDMNGGIGIGTRPLFTALQWKELQHQALIFKYLLAGHQVPTELLLPIHNSSFYFDSNSMSSSPLSYFHSPNTHTTMEGFCSSSYYGKKLDPEPGRCRRTDGKKWRCSKDANPDSKYCERHMRKRRNNNGSRKPVEIHTALSLPSLKTNTTMTSLTAAAATGSNGSFQNFPLLSMGNKEPRYSLATKSETNENGFFSETSQTKGLGMHLSLDNTLCATVPQASLFPSSKLRNGVVSQSDYPQSLTLQDLGYATSNTIESKLPPRQQYWSFDSESGSRDPMKQETQSLRSFYDEWPTKTRDYWLDLENEYSVQSPFSTTTQLSMSMPVTSFCSSAASSHSPTEN